MILPYSTTNPYDMSDVTGYQMKDFIEDWSLSDITKTLFEAVETADWSTSKWYADTKYYDELFNRLFSKWYDSNYFCYIDIEPLGADETADSRKEQVKKYIYRKLLTTAYNTHDYYIEQLKRYSEFLTEDFADVITSTSAVRVNDTPTSKGKWSANDYTSAITQSTATQSIDSVDRYQQVRKLITNIYERWMADFKPFEKIMI